jgi:hypothetical protein
MTRQDLHDARWPLVAAVVLAAAGGLIVGLGGSTALVAVGLTLAGSAGVLVVAAVFYAIGRSEDRERETRR